MKFRVPFLFAFSVCITLFFGCNSGNQTATKSEAVLDTVSLSSKSYALAYQDGDKIVATSIDTMKQISFGGATDPAISPDGNMFAYTVPDSSGGRSIWIADLENKSQLQLQTNSNNFYGATWAPDGHLVAFSISNKDGVWKIGLMKPDNTGFVILDNHSKVSYNAPTWKGNKELVAHNLDTLFTFDATGKLLTTQDISELISKDYGLSSSSKFFFTQDGNTLVFNATHGESVAELKSRLESVFSLDLKTKKITRISPAGINVPYLFVTADDRIFFSGAAVPFTNQKVYFADLEGNVKTLVERGANPNAN